MNWFVYILHSSSLRRYYVGMTQKIRRRIKQHLRGENFWTQRTDDWEMVYSSEAMNIDQARQLEIGIKKRGAKRFLQSQSILKRSGQVEGS